MQEQNRRERVMLWFLGAMNSNNKSLMPVMFCLVEFATITTSLLIPLLIKLVMTEFDTSFLEVFYLY